MGLDGLVSIAVKGGLDMVKFLVQVFLVADVECSPYQGAVDG